MNAKGELCIYRKAIVLLRVVAFIDGLKAPNMGEAMVACYAI